MGGANDSLTAEIEGPVKTTNTLLWQDFHQGYSLNPDNIAITAIHQKAGNLDALVGVQHSDKTDTEASPHHGQELTWTYRQLHHGACRISSFLNRSKVPKNSVIMLLIPNCAESLLFFWLSAMDSFIMSPLDKRATMPERKEDLRFYLSNLKPTVAIVADGFAVRVVQDTCDELNLKLTVGLSLANQPEDAKLRLPKPWRTLESIADESFSISEVEERLDLQSPHIASIQPDRTFIILFTSGTSSGQPKGCSRSDRNMTKGTSNSALTCFVNDKTVMILQTANFRAVFLDVTCTIFKYGGRLVLGSEGFEPKKIIDAIETQGVNAMAAVPHHVYSISEHPTYSPTRVANMKNVMLCGDVITSVHLSRTQGVFPNAQVNCIFGMTECAGTFGATSRDSSLDMHRTHRDVVTCGKVMPNVKVRIVDDDKARNILGRGELGSLHISNDGCIRNYLNNVQPEVFYIERGRTWMITGDLVVIDEEGYVFVMGRSKDVIKRAGVPMTPANLEACLSRKLKANVEVIGLPHPSLGAEPWAIIENFPDGVSPSELQELIIKSFGAEYALGGILTLEDLQMQAWPVNESQKVSKIKLREAAIILSSKVRISRSL